MKLNILHLQLPQIFFSAIILLLATFILINCNTNDTLPTKSIILQSNSAIQTYNKDKKIKTTSLLVFYANSLSDKRSHVAASQAIKLGYRNVYTLPGGFAVWNELKYPTTN